MADLSTNYMDDILAESMNGKRKYRITRADGSFEEVTLEDISEYEQRGSVFGAGDINRTNQAVNEKFDSGDVVDPMETTVPGFAADALAVKNHFNEQNKNLGGLRFGVDGDGNGGYYKADDSFVPFRRGVTCVSSQGNFNYTFTHDSPNARLMTGVTTTYWSATLNGTKLSAANYGKTDNGWGHSRTSEFAVKKGDVISVTGTAAYGYTLVY